MLRKYILKPLQNFQIAKYSNLSNLIKFNEEESGKILEIINNKTPEELTNYDISKGRSQKIYARRTKNGEFKNLEEILQLDGFGIKILEKIAKSILNNKTKSDIQKDLLIKQSNKICIPLVTDKVRINCKSLVSLIIGVSSVSWTRIKLNGFDSSELTHWQHNDILYKKLHLNDLIQRCIYLDYEIPEADCYIFENPQIAQSTIGATNAEQININVQKSQLLSIISFALAKRNKINGEQLKNRAIEKLQIENNIFYMKRFISAKLFNIVVGTEKVSTSDNISNLIHGNYDDQNYSSEALNTNFKVPMNYKEIYGKSENYQKELMGQSLLLGLAFLRLAILKCPYSLKKISNRIL